MLYDLKIPNEKGYYDLFVETKNKYSLEELKEKLYQENISEDLKEDIEFATELSVENYNMKFFFIKNGFKVIELKEVL